MALTVYYVSEQIGLISYIVIEPRYFPRILEPNEVCRLTENNKKQRKHRFKELTND